MRPIFVAEIRHEAEHWARAWGFSPGEWVWVGRPEHLLGRRAVDSQPVFLCGSARFRIPLVEGLEMAGFDVKVDAHDLDTNYEPRSALNLLP